MKNSAAYASGIETNETNHCSPHEQYSCRHTKKMHSDMYTAICLDEIKSSVNDQSRPRFLSLFGGCGGLDIGFLSRGFHCVASIDVNAHAAKNNHNNLRTKSIVRDLSVGHLDDFCENNVDVIVAGPPCQGFSNAGKRDVHDPRNNLLIVAGEICVKIKPRVFVVENVPGALTGDHRLYWERLEQLLRDNGYSTTTSVIQCAKLGMAQMRKRAVLIAYNGNCDVKLPDIDLAPSTLAEAIGDIPNDASNHESHYYALTGANLIIGTRIPSGKRLSNVRGDNGAVRTWDIPEVYGFVTSEERLVLERIVRLRRRFRERQTGDADPVHRATLASELGWDPSHILESLFEKGHLREIGRGIDIRSTFNGKFRRLQWGRPSYTVDTRFGDPRLFLHPVAQRGFSVREAARIQGFPDWYKFEGPLREQFKLVGNAVPPPMASFIANYVRSLMRG